MKAIGSFILTGVVGTYIASKFQRNSYINQAKTLKTEKEVEKIKEITKRISTLASARNISARILVDNIYSKNNDAEKTLKLREEYRKSVSEWNMNIQTIYIDLFANDMYPFAILLESTVHESFRKSHMLINEKINNFKDVKSSEIESHLSSAFKQTRSLSLSLIERANEKMEQALNGNTENLSAYNLHNASSLTLIIALFHSHPNLLRIPRSNNN